MSHDQKQPSCFKNVLLHARSCFEPQHLRSTPSKEQSALRIMYHFLNRRVVGQPSFIKKSRDSSALDMKSVGSRQTTLGTSSGLWDDSRRQT
jgi:hypothetical protein